MRKLLVVLSYVLCPLHYLGYAVGIVCRPFVAGFSVGYKECDIQQYLTEYEEAQNFLEENNVEC